MLTVGCDHEEPRMPSSFKVSGQSVTDVLNTGYMDQIGARSLSESMISFHIHCKDFEPLPFLPALDQFIPFFHVRTDWIRLTLNQVVQYYFTVTTKYCYSSTGFNRVFSCLKMRLWSPTESSEAIHLFFLGKTIWSHSWNRFCCHFREQKESY